ncbi:hypothetical protein CA54_37780 [Symmachiella macrocystis]|uniref:GYF domain-containing protein n=1 Tax=Symmachiella macrocystis TaxID=2527985 RepID=A0A5C6BSB3_9PLAN|nr:DUF4339 domain-containing protein [Symmachiella macrocystis]TWU14908.1 hypothetical protein CA54_37780 [Symmachiella macrocystis]
MSEKWFFNRQDGCGVQGPFQLDHITNLFHQGELEPNHLVRCGAIGQWASLDDWKWFYNPKDGSGVHGPVTRIQLAEFLEAEEITDKTEARDGGLGEWQPLSVILGDAAALSGELATGETATLATSTNLEDDDFELSMKTTAHDNPEPSPELEAIPDEGVGPDDDLWYCDLSGQLDGPLPWSRVHSLASMGRIKRSDKIRHASDVYWKIAEEFEGLFPKSEPSVTQVPAADSPLLEPDPLAAEGDTETPADSRFENPNLDEAPNAPLDAKMTDWLDQETAEPEPSTDPIVEPAIEAAIASAAGENRRRNKAKARRAASTKPQKPSTPKPRRSWSPRFDFAALFTAARMKTIVTVLGVAALVGGGYFLFGMSRAQDLSAYAAYQSFWKDYKDLRAQNASSLEWAQLNARVRQGIGPLVEQLEGTASSSRTAEQALLYVGRDCIPKMMAEGRSQPCEAEKYFIQHLETVRKKMPEADLQVISPDPNFE